MKTDTQIQQDVIAELKWEPKVNATHIGVEVKNGVVTLSGHVDSFAEKWHAEQAAKRVEGVWVIAIELDVILSDSSKKVTLKLLKQHLMPLNGMFISYPI